MVAVWRYGRAAPGRGAIASGVGGRQPRAPCDAACLILLPRSLVQNPLLLTLGLDSVSGAKSRFLKAVYYGPMPSGGYASRERPRAAAAGRDRKVSTTASVASVSRFLQMTTRPGLLSLDTPDQERRQDLPALPLGRY
jgi:hypothetical protein